MLSFAGKITAMTTDDDKLEADETLAPVERTPDGFVVISQHVIPARFRDIYGKQHKLLMPLLLSLAVAILIVIFVPIDFIFLMVLAASTISIGHGIGNKRIIRARKDIAAHPTIQQMASDSGLPAEDIGDKLAEFALGARSELIIPLDNGFQMYLNMAKYEDDGSFIETLPEVNQSMGLLAPADAADAN